jgi:excisionase family DNA binding protein
MRNGAPKEISGIPPGHTPIAVVDQVQLHVGLDPYLSLRALAEYAGLSRRTLHNLVNDPHDPVPSYRIGGKLLVRRSEFDTWIARRRNTRAQALTHLAAADAHALLTARNNSVKAY